MFGRNLVTTCNSRDPTIKSRALLGNYLDINECFVELPNFQLTVDSMAVESVEFKDDCLRACLRSFLRGKPCAGAEHRPKDNACVLSEKTGERRLNNEPKTGSYFENVCARPQGTSSLEPPVITLSVFSNPLISLSGDPVTIFVRAHAITGAAFASSAR
nr:unnamed protein product [Haemonchus contortus]